MNNKLYHNQERYDRQDAELAEEEAKYRAHFAEDSGERLDTPREIPSNANPLDNPTDLPASNREEETWKKRHGDLRSYTSRQINEKDRELAELKKLLAEKEREANKLPTNKAEAEEWVRQYPDLARVLSTLFETQTEYIKEDVKTVRQELEAERISIAREKAMNAILKAHPDFPELVNSEDFQAWVVSQPEKRGPRIGQALYDALYNNETDAYSAIEAVNVFKADKKASGTPKNTTAREAATSVRRTATSTPQSTNGQRVFSESEIDKMKPWEFTDEVEKEIDRARRDGRFVYDVTGAAR